MRVKLRSADGLTRWIEMDKRPDIGGVISLDAVPMIKPHGEMRLKWPIRRYEYCARFHDEDGEYLFYREIYEE